MPTEFHFVDNDGNRYAAVARTKNMAKNELKGSYPGAVLRLVDEVTVKTPKKENLVADSVVDMMKSMKRIRKVGRNEKCPCGSGKKFKRCCGSNQSS